MGKSLLRIWHIVDAQWILMASPFFSDQIRSDQSLSRVRLFATPWIAARQASLAITNSRSSLRLTSIESVMPCSHLILSHPLLLLPPIPPSIRVFSNKSTLRMRWPKYWSFSFSIIPSKEHPGLISWPKLQLWKSQEHKQGVGTVYVPCTQQHQRAGQTTWATPPPEPWTHPYPHPI